MHVLKSILGNLFWTKEGSCCGKILMAFCFDEGLEGGDFFHAILTKECSNLAKCAENLCSWHAEIT